MRLGVTAGLLLASASPGWAEAAASDPPAGLLWNGKHGDHWAVYRKSNGSDEPLTSPDADHWVWSAAGNRVMGLMRRAREDGSLAWFPAEMDADGAIVRLMSDLPVTNDSWHCSPRSGQCLVGRRLGDRRAIFDTASGVVDAPFLDDEGASYSDPEFSPDGTRLLFRSDRSGAWEVWIADADGGNATALTGDPANDGASEHEYQGEGPAHFSPDGQEIVWTRKYPETGYDVWIMRADGSAKRNLTAGHAKEDTYPFFSPDGEWIAFSSSRDGNDEIYVMRPDGSDVRRVTENDGPDLAPMWVTVK